MTNSLAGETFGVSPPATQPLAPIGVLTSDHGPQCTATVINLKNSYFDTSLPADLLLQSQELRRQFATGNFNDNVVVTAAHCVVSESDPQPNGFMFAPGFTGIAPRYSKDFTSGPNGTSGQVSPQENTDQFGIGSPFAGQPVGQSPHGVWGCSRDNASKRPCGGVGPLSWGGCERLCYGSGQIG
jgi:hypothetical protein